MQEHADIILSGQMPIELMQEYLVWHDCGKPFIMETDEQGRHHFPNHSTKSREIWLLAGGSIEAAQLMGMDMDLHLLSAEDIPAFKMRPESMSLLVAAFAEIYANASLFGGYNSTSFKIKWKHLSRRSKALLNLKK